MTETTRKKRLRWGGSPRRLPAHPYRDSAIVYGILAAVVVGVTALTNGNLGPDHRAVAVRGGDRLQLVAPAAAGA
jgi:hypothetical protein